jgi:hypothetical protein
MGVRGQGTALEFPAPRISVELQQSQTNEFDHDGLGQTFSRGCRCGPQGVLRTSLRVTDAKGEERERIAISRP